MPLASGFPSSFAICLYRSGERAKVADAASVKGDPSHEKVRGDENEIAEKCTHNEFLGSNLNVFTKKEIYIYICMHIYILYIYTNTSIYTYIYIYTRIILLTYSQ